MTFMEMTQLSRNFRRWPRPWWARKRLSLFPAAPWATSARCWRIVMSGVVRYGSFALQTCTGTQRGPTHVHCWRSNAVCYASTLSMITECAQRITQVPNLKSGLLVQVIVGDESHLFQYEADGVSVLGGVGMYTVPTAENGELPLAALSKAVR